METWPSPTGIAAGSIDEKLEDEVVVLEELDDGALGDGLRLPDRATGCEEQDARTTDAIKATAVIRADRAARVFMPGNYVTAMEEG